MNQPIEPAAYLPSADHADAERVALYEATDGRQGNLLQGKPCVILTTIGRKSGAIRKTPLMRVTDGTRYAVVASQGGAPRHPNWFLNLRDNPTVRLRDGAVERSYTARITEDAERKEWWQRAAEAWPSYDEYTTRTGRVIPLVVLEPIE